MTRLGQTGGRAQKPRVLAAGPRPRGGTQGNTKAPAGDGQGDRQSAVGTYPEDSSVPPLFTQCVMAVHLLCARRRGAELFQDRGALAVLRGVDLCEATGFGSGPLAGPVLGRRSGTWTLPAPLRQAVCTCRIPPGSEVSVLLSPYLRGRESGPGRGGRMAELAQVTWLGLGHQTSVVPCGRGGRDSTQGHNHNPPLLAAPDGESGDGPFPCSRPCHLLGRAADGKA